MTKRTETFLMKLTVEEKRELAARAAAQGVSMSVYGRRRLCGVVPELREAERRADVLAGVLPKPPAALAELAGRLGSPGVGCSPDGASAIREKFAAALRDRAR